MKISTLYSRCVTVRNDECCFPPSKDRGSSPRRERKTLHQITSQERPGLWVFGPGLPKSRLRGRLLQRPLYPRPQGETPRRSIETQDRRNLPSVRQPCGWQGWLGLVPTSFSSPPSPGDPGRVHRGNGRFVLSLRWRLPTSSLRLPPSRPSGERPFAIGHGGQSIGSNHRPRSCEMRPPLCELPSDRTFRGIVGRGWLRRVDEVEAAALRLAT